MSDNLIQHVAQPHPVCSGNGMGIPDPQIIEFIDIRHEFIKAVHLIYHQYHRFMGTPQHIRYFGIRIHQSLPYIHHKKDYVCGIYGNLGLLPHLGQDNIAAVRLNTSGIYHGKGTVQPCDIRINTIPGDTRRILNN